MHVTRMYVQFKMKSDTNLTGYLLVMCDNDFTTLSIIMMILAWYDSYHIQACI